MRFVKRSVTAAWSRSARRLRPSLWCSAATTRNNVDRIAKVLRAEKGTGGHVQCSRHAYEYVEAVAAVESLGPQLAKGRSCAILARTNRILDPLEVVCRTHGIKYYRASGLPVLSRPKGAHLCAICSRSSRV